MCTSNLFADFFRGDKVDKLSLQALDHVLVFTVSAGKIYMRPFAVDFKKSGSRVNILKLLQSIMLRTLYCDYCVPHMNS